MKVGIMRWLIKIFTPTSYQSKLYLWSLMHYKIETTPPPPLPKKKQKTENIKTKNKKQKQKQNKNKNNRKGNLFTYFHQSN